MPVFPGKALEDLANGMFQDNETKKLEKLRMDNYVSNVICEIFCAASLQKPHDLLH